jgi:hypothetical protein
MEKVKFMIYSAHDDQLINTMIWLAPTNYEMDFTPFASQVVFELSYDNSCTTANDDCFKVHTRYCGIELDLPNCPIGCSFPQFEALM